MRTRQSLLRANVPVPEIGAHARSSFLASADLRQLAVPAQPKHDDHRQRGDEDQRKRARVARRRTELAAVLEARLQSEAGDEECDRQGKPCRTCGALG